MAQGQAKHARYEKAQNIGDHFLSSRIPAAVPALPKITKAKPPDDAVSPEPISQATESTSVPATARHPRRPRLSAWQRPEGLVKSRCMSFDIDTGMHTYMCIYVYMYAVCVTNIHAYIYIYINYIYTYIHVYAKKLSSSTSFASLHLRPPLESQPVRNCKQVAWKIRQQPDEGNHPKPPRIKGLIERQCHYSK